MALTAGHRGECDSSSLRAEAEAEAAERLSCGTGDEDGDEISGGAGEEGLSLLRSAPAAAGSGSRDPCELDFAARARPGEVALLLFDREEK